MNEIVRALVIWIIQNVLSIASLIMSTFIAFYLYLLEQRRDQEQANQVNDFNNWIKEQTQRQISILEALQQVLPEKVKTRLSKEVARLIPESIQIGNLNINRPSLRIAQALLGGKLYIEATAYGDEGERIKSQIEMIDEGEIIKLVTPKYANLAIIKKINIEKEILNSSYYYTFRLWIEKMKKK